MYFPNSIDRREIHEWAEQNGYFHHSYLEERFEYVEVPYLECNRCSKWSNKLYMKTESCTCPSCGYHFGTCKYCDKEIEFTLNEVKFVKRNNMIVVSKNQITTKRGKSGLLGVYSEIKPVLGTYDCFGNFN
jgi:hypothetical protein